MGSSARLILVSVLLGCSAADRGAGEPVTGAFGELFRITDRITLQEEPADPIADIGVFTELDDGFVIADALQARVRRYSASGLLAGSFGRFGEGPFEFQRIGGVVQPESARIALIDPRLSRVTLVTRNFEPDSLFQLAPRPHGPMKRFGAGFVGATAAAARASSFTAFDSLWRPAWSVPAPSPGSMFDYPYWGSLATLPFATAGQTLIAAYSLLYPIYLYDAAGSAIDSLMSAPANFRKVSVVERGAFGGPGSTERLDAWLASFDIVARLDVLSDSLLVVTHGRLERSPAAMFTELHDRLDVYDVASRRKLAENIALPAGARVLGGGRALYVLVAQPPEGWVIVRAEF